MNIFTIVFLLLDSIALLLVKRSLATLPLLLGVCYIPAYLSIHVGPLHFTAVRVLVAVGFIRVIIRGEWPSMRASGIDRVMLAWAAWLLISGFFHEDPMSTFIFRLGLIYDACGIYALIKIFCKNLEDICAVCKLTAFLLAPLALEMFYEKLAIHNLFSILGGGDTPIIREGKVRANGPFGHPILAGTAGAVCLPMMIGLWREDKRTALIGIISCLVIIFSSASSGPILSSMAGIFALFMWRYRNLIPLLQRWAIPGYIALDLYMKDPAYFIIARIDLAGGSTSWYRCRLIQSAIEHLSEWWLIGTDYTRHWMWVVVTWSPNHTDITSHYIQMGVLGGLPLLVLFIWVLVKGFNGITQALQNEFNNSPNARFMIWTLGASLFVHTATFVSVSYFDQSFVFLYLALGAISSASTDLIENQHAQSAITKFFNTKHKVSQLNRVEKDLITSYSVAKTNLISRLKIR